MITKIKTNQLNYLTKDVDLNYPNQIKQYNIIIAPNGYGKTQLIKAIRSKLFEKTKRKDVELDFSEEFKKDPKGVYFTINEELDKRAIGSSINTNDSKSFLNKTMEYMHRSELSNGQEQKRTIDMFLKQLILPETIWFLDEPEKSLDIVQLDLMIKKILSLNIQVFIVTHSPILINNENFNKIILDEEYFKKVENILK
jgi:energy-coupling factor transporter ATP-binding protein EcfA2